MFLSGLVDKRRQQPSPDSNARVGSVDQIEHLATTWLCALYKQDDTLVPQACSFDNCPKRTGFNKLLFPDVRKNSCTSPDCFRPKIDASVKKTPETNPQLIQISAAWNSREGAPLGRNRYVELEIKKPNANGASTKLPA
jgi:hypothetical protein